MKSAEETPPDASSSSPPPVVETPPNSYRMEEIVRRTGLTPRAIRYYEEMGLLAPSGRTAGGFRLFTEAEIAVLLRIKELQTVLGISLAEIKETLHADAVRAELRLAYQQATDPDTRVRVLDDALTLAEAQMRVIDERAERLAKMREGLQERLTRIGSLRDEARRERDARSQTPERLEQVGESR